MRIGYARVSTPEQSCTLQREALEQSGCVKVFAEVASGAKAARPASVRAGRAAFAPLATSANTLTHPLCSSASRWSVQLCSGVDTRA